MFKRISMLLFEEFNEDTTKILDSIQSEGFAVCVDTEDGEGVVISIMKEV